MARGFAECSIITMICYAQLLSHVCKHIDVALWPDLLYQKQLVSVTFVFQFDVHKCPNSIDSLRLLPTVIFSTICYAA